VQYFAVSSRGWVEIIYKLYYLLRIFTRYTEQNNLHFEKNSFNRKICFNTIGRIRELEFLFLKENILEIENNGPSPINTINLLLDYESKRRKIVMEFREKLKLMNRDLEMEELFIETDNYLLASQNFENHLNGVTKEKLTELL
ncbi:MAG: hypothetical protein AAFY71_16925, partial [Bacteroidota bacterium]